MSRSYDIFLSHSGAQKEFVEHLNAELGRVCGHYSVFFDRDAIQHGDQISTTILEYAKTCKLAVAVLSEEYFTRSRPPMMELVASYTASKDGIGVPCLFPVFLVLKPEDAKDHNVQLEWQKTWQKWEVNEKMSERRKCRTSRVQPAVWKEAVERLLDTRGPIYKPHENENNPETFMKKVAQFIAHRLDILSRSLQDDEEVDRSKATGMEDLGKSVNTTPLAGEVGDEKEVTPEPYMDYRVVVSLQFGISSSMSSFAHVTEPNHISTFYDYPSRGGEKPSCDTLTGIYYYPGVHGGQVKAWGNLARCEYERDMAQARKSSELTVGTYVTRFNPHLTSLDMEVSSAGRSRRVMPVERPITDYLREMSTFILGHLQYAYGSHLTMKSIQWCVPVPSSWDNAAKEKMITCMEAAGLVHGTDGSTHPVKMVSALEAASFYSIRSYSSQTYSSLQWEVGDKLMVVDIGERTINVVVQEVVFVCKHIYNVKEVSSSLFTRYSSLDSRKFLELLERKIGPCMHEFLTKYPTDGSLKVWWDQYKSVFGHEMIHEDFEICLPATLRNIWESYDQKMGLPERESYYEISISYVEIQMLFDPVIDDILVCICDEVGGVWGGVKALNLVGDSLLGIPYVMSNIKQKLSRLVPEIIIPVNLLSAASQGAVALALDLCNCAGSTS